MKILPCYKKIMISPKKIGFENQMIDSDLRPLWACLNLSAYMLLLRTREIVGDMFKMIGLATITLTGFVGYSVLFSFILGLQPVDAVKLAITGHLETNPMAVFETVKAETDSLNADMKSRLKTVQDSIAIELRNVNTAKTELAQLRDELKTLLDEKKKMEDVSLYNLAKIYNDMDPLQLADIMIDLDDLVIVAIIPRMKNQKASRILEMLPPERAAAISAMLLGKK